MLKRLLKYFSTRLLTHETALKSFNWLRWKTRYLSRNFWPDWSTWLCSYIDTLLLKLQSNVQIINFFKQFDLRAYLYVILSFFPFYFSTLSCLIYDASSRYITSSARERYNAVRNFQRFTRLP